MVNIMVRIASLTIFSLAVYFSSSPLIASQDFRTEIRECYDEAFQAVLTAEAEIKKPLACVESYKKALAGVEEAHTDAFYGALQGFNKEERKRIFASMSDDFMEATVHRMFPDELDLPNEVSSVAQAGGDGVVSLGIRLSGIWLLDEDQQCKRDGQCFPCGQQARQFLDQVIAGKAIECNVGISRHGGSEGICRVEGKDIGLLLVENGWAELDERDTAENAIAFRQYFDAFSTAKDNRRGIHGTEYKDYYRRSAGVRMECSQ